MNLEIEAFKKQMDALAEHRSIEAAGDPQLQAALVATFINQWLRENNYFGAEPWVANEAANRIADKWLLYVYGMTSLARESQTGFKATP